MAKKHGKNNYNNKNSNQFVGSISQPTVLDSNSKLDIDTQKTLLSEIIEAGISGGLDSSKLEDFTSVSNSRSQIYQLIDTMCADASVSTIVKTYAEEVCEAADSGHVVWCESSDPNISKFINYLLNVMNVDKNIYAWVYCLIKYGDVYLKLYRESDYEDKIFNKQSVDTAYSCKQPLHEQLDEAVYVSTHSVLDRYSYYAEMVADPGTMFELTKYGKTFGYIETPNEPNSTNYLNSYIGTDAGSNSPVMNYSMKSNDVNVHQADDYVHACLDDNFSRFPEKVDMFLTDADYKAQQNATSYNVRRGKSLLIDAYKIWREKTLLENAILLNRLTKSSVIRNIQVEVGDMPKSQVKNTLRRIKELFEQKTAINTGTGMVEYSNPGPVENNIFTATHDGKGAITVNAVGGDLEVKNLGDLDEWVNKFYAAFGIPKQYYGYTEDGAGFNGGTSLAIISSVFAKSVKRIQNSILQMLTDAINLFLVNRGCNTYINNFVLKMKAPLTQEEKDYREDLTNRISAISNAQALFADIENKGRKLRILKTLVSTLNYGDEILEEIQAEINAAEEAEKNEAENGETENNASGDETSESGTSNEEDLNLDITATEGLKKVSGNILLEQNDSASIDLSAIPLGEDASTDLPTPEELNGSKNFVDNNN